MRADDRYSRARTIISGSPIRSLESLRGKLIVEMIACHYRGMLHTQFGVLATGQAFNQRIVVGVMKKADREPFCADRDVDRWIDDAMQGRHPAIIGPAGHHVANVDNERASGRADRQSLARFALHLQADGAKSGFNMVIVPKSVWAPARSWPGSAAYPGVDSTSRSAH